MKKWFNIFTALLVTAIVLTIYFFSVALHHAYIGANVIIKDNLVFVHEMEPLTWASDNLEPGDRIISIDGNPPLEFKPIQKWNLLERAETIVIESKNGDIKKLTVTDEDGLQTIFQSIIPLIFVVLSIFCSTFIYKSYKKSENTRESAILLILFLFSASLGYLCGGASAKGDYASRILVGVFLLTTPIFYMHFLRTYFEELGTVWFSKKILWFSYSLVVVNSSLVIFQDQLGLNGLITKTTNLISFFIVFVLCAAVVVIGHKKIAYKAQKYMIRVLILSNGLAFLPFFLLYVLPYMIFKVQVFPPAYLMGFLILIPFSLVYQFLAKKLYDIEFILGRMKYYTLASIFPSLVGVILVFATKSPNQTIYSVRIFLMLFIALVVFCYIGEYLAVKFNLTKFKHKANYQEILFEYTRKIRVAKNFNEVYNLLKTVIIDTLLIDKTYLIEISKDGKASIIDAYLDEESFLKEYKDSIDTTKNKLAHIQELDKGFILNIGEAESNQYLILGLSSVNLPKLTIDEKLWLETLTHYTNVTLENFVKIEDLMEHLEELENKPAWFNKIAFSLEEKQRSILAKELHDSVLQDLLSIKRQIELLTSNSNDEVAAGFSNVVDSMENAINTTRETCNELRPQVLYDLGLDRALKKLVNQNQNQGYEIKVTTSNLDSSIHKEVQLSIYRIIQELLNNAKKHSHASDVRVVAVRIKEKVVIHYEDDGVGYDDKKIFNKEGSMGLSGVRERVQSMNGTIKIETKPNEGFKVIIEI